MGGCDCGYVIVDWSDLLMQTSVCLYNLVVLDAQEMLIIISLVNQLRTMLSLLLHFLPQPIHLLC